MEGGAKGATRRDREIQTRRVNRMDMLEESNKAEMMRSAAAEIQLAAWSLEIFEVSGREDDEWDERAWKRNRGLASSSMNSIWSSHQVRRRGGKNRSGSSTVTNVATVYCTFCNATQCNINTKLK